MRHNIPLEMRELDQWVVSGKDKIPLNPRTGEVASPTDPATWGTYQEACRSAQPNIGFVLAEWDPFCIIDLDNKPDNPATAEQLDRHNKILETFQSYTERSVSGHGYHIIVKGSVPSGLHRDNVEIYSKARYMICTGDVVKNLPIADGYQDLLLSMHSQMTPSKADLVQVDSDTPDRDIIEKAMRAENADKFNRLCQGDMCGYASQSEADFALLSMLCFYTKDNSQVRRLFRMSALGKRDKAIRNDKYLDRALEKIRASEPAPIDFSAIKSGVERIACKIPAGPVCGLPSAGGDLHGVELPPGLVGEIAQYIYKSAVRPVAEVALCGALAFTAGIAGRAYNISGTGLNQYFMLLAKTGSGKEGAASGIDNLVSAVRQTVPSADSFVGPAAFASGQALIRSLDESPCFFSILGEFGLTLQQICDHRANGAQQMLKRVLLDLYTKSGHDKILRSSVYSDKEKNTKNVNAPALTILGESTQETFFQGLDDNHIAEGLIPRFTIIEYNGKRPPRNRAAGTPPPAQLVQRLADFITSCLAINQNNTFGSIRMEQDATKTLDAFDILCDKKINDGASNVEVHLWNRAHLKTLKMAGLIAVGCNFHNPIVTEENAQWAVRLITAEIEKTAYRFQKGDVGFGDSKQLAELKRVCSEYLSGGYKAVSNYGIHKQIFDAGLIPYSYLSARLINLAVFKQDRRGGISALKAALHDLTETGALTVVESNTMSEKYKQGGKAYGIANGWQ